MILTAAYLEDGEFFGASAHPDARYEWYWLGLTITGEPFALVRMDVPEALAPRFMEHGTYDQWFSDGYEAAAAAHPYLVAVIYWTYHYPNCELINR